MRNSWKINSPTTSLLVFFHLVSHFWPEKGPSRPPVEDTGNEPMPSNLPWSCRSLGKKPALQLVFRWFEHGENQRTIANIWEFSKIGVPPVIIHFSGIFPCKPSFLSIPTYGTPPYEFLKLAKFTLVYSPNTALISLAERGNFMPFFWFEKKWRVVQSCNWLSSLCIWFLEWLSSYFSWNCFHVHFIELSVVYFAHAQNSILW